MDRATARVPDSLTDWNFLAGRAWKHLSLKRPLSTVLIPSPSEPAVSQYVSSIRGNCFIDVGANVGMYALRYRRNFWHVYAVEPHPYTLKMLRFKGMIRLARNVTVLDCAASDTDGETTLFLDGTVGRSAGSADTIEPSFTYRPASSPNLTVHYPSGNTGKRSVIVDAIRLDSYPFPSPALVKIDVEGAEFRVIAGARKTLGRARRVIVEVHDRTREEQMGNILDGMGFKTRWIAPDHILGERN